ncbi:MAG: hypothetical protein AAGG45_01860 [Pseudomonadota bacterium]
MIDSPLVWLLFVGGLLLFTWIPNRTLEATECRLGWGWKTAYAMVTMLFVIGTFAYTYATLFVEDYNVNYFILFVCYILTPILIYASIDGFTRRIEWDETGLRFQSVFKSRRHVPWDDVIAIKPIHLMQAKGVYFTDGTRLTFSEVMFGSRALVRACEEFGQLEK